MNRTVFKHLILQHEIVNSRRVAEVSIAEHDPQTLCLCIVSSGTTNTLDISTLDHNTLLVIHYADLSWAVVAVKTLTHSCVSLMSDVNHYMCV